MPRRCFSCKSFKQELWVRQPRERAGKKDEKRKRGRVCRGGHELCHCQSKRRKTTTCQAQHADLWSKIPNEHKARLHSASAQLTGVSSPRAKDLVDIAHASMACGTDFLVDISQSASTKPWNRCGGRPMRSMCASSVYYYAKLDRCLLSREHWHVVGFDNDGLDLSRLSPHALRNLAGEAMSPPCAGLLLMIICKQLPVWGNI